MSTAPSPLRALAALSAALAAAATEAATASAGAGLAPTWPVTYVANRSSYLYTCDWSAPIDPAAVANWVRCEASRTAAIAEMLTEALAGLLLRSRTRARSRARAHTDSLHTRLSLARTLQSIVSLDWSNQKWGPSGWASAKPMDCEERLYGDAVSAVAGSSSPSTTRGWVYRNTCKVRPFSAQ